MTVAKELFALVSVPALRENGAATLVRPDPAAPVPVTPEGRLTETSKTRLAGTLGFVGLVTEKLGTPPLHRVGARLVGMLTAGVGSTFTFTNCCGPLLQPFNLGVIV